MNIQTWSLIVVTLIALQMTVVYVITRANQDVFGNRAASHYAQAIAELAKKRPLAGAVIRICYGLCLIEVLGLAIAKYASAHL
jgi:hypothetical protein